MSNLEKLSSVDEQRLIGSVREAIAQANQGADPSAAIAKVASDRNYNPEFVGRMVEMFNTSKTLAHLKNTKEASARAGDFGLACTDKVMASMFPARLNQSTQDLPIGLGEMGKSAGYCGVTQEKVASFEKSAGYVEDGAAKFKKAEALLRDMKRDVSTMKTAQAALGMKRDELLVKAATYFRTVGHAPFEDVDACMQSMYGAAGTLAMDVVYGACNGPALREKRASAVDRPRLADRSAEPYASICGFVDISREMAKSAAEIETMQAELKEAAEAFKARIKQADMLDALGGGLLTTAVTENPITGGSEAAGQKALSKALESATDPMHENIIRGIETEGMLQKLISTDPVLAKYDPADVVDAFNEISRFSPMAASQPMIARSYLRKLLESSPNPHGRTMEPFDAGQLVDIESKMRKPEVMKQTMTVAPTTGL